MATPSGTVVRKWMEQLGISPDAMAVQREISAQEGLNPEQGGEPFTLLAVTQCGQELYWELSSLRAAAQELRDKPVAPRAGYTKQLVMKYLRMHGYAVRSNYAITRMAMLLLERCITYEIGAMATGEQSLACR